MAKTAQKVPVSKRALIQRVNRVLAGESEAIKTCREGQWRAELGEHYIIDVSRNFVLHKHVDLEELGRELACLKEWERLEA